MLRFPSSHAEGGQTPFDNLDLGPSPSDSITENLASLPDFALLALANSTQDLNVARMVVQELYLRLELRAWTDILPEEESMPEDLDEAALVGEEETVELPSPFQRSDYETTLLRAYRESARRPPYGS